MMNRFLIHYHRNLQLIVVVQLLQHHQYVLYLNLQHHLMLLPLLDLDEDVKYEYVETLLPNEHDRLALGQMFYRYSN